MNINEMNKSEQRAELKKLRNSIPAQFRNQKSQSIANRLFETKEYINSSTILIYISIGSEVDTGEILSRAISDGKRIAVPMCSTEDCTITAYLIKDICDLKQGSYGIAEPRRELIDNGIIVPASKKEIDLVIVPGLGFDQNGYRIGYGKGYYDRYLCNFRGFSAGLCYSDCCIDKISCSKFDIKVDKVITENKTISTL